MSNEWITDRLPTVEDADDDDGVLVIHDWDLPAKCVDWKEVTKGQQWKRTDNCIKNARPKRYEAQWSNYYVCWVIMHGSRFITYLWELEDRDAHRKAAEEIAATYERVIP